MQPPASATTPALRRVEEFGLEMVDMGVTAEEAEDILHHLKRAADAAAP